MKQIFLALALFFPVCALAQLTESFNGPDVYSANPWEGDLTKFFINESKELQLSAHTSSGNARIYVESSCWKENEWQCTVRSDYQGSTYNYFRIYLWSEKPDMDDPGKAVFIRLGHRNQNVAICHQDENTGLTVLVEGRALFDTPTQIDIKAVTDAEGICTVYTKTASDTDYYREGAIKWGLQDTPGYFMLGAYYSADHGRDKYFDNVYIGRYEAQQLPPTEPEDTLQPLQLISVSEVDEFELQLTFSKPVQAEYASFTLTGMGEADEVYLSEDETIITLVWEAEREKDKEYQLTYSYLFDYDWEEYEGYYPFVSSLGKQKPTQPSEPENPKEGPATALGAVLINEVMADPKGLTALPETEYIELHNALTQSVSLKDWVLYYGDKPTVLTEISVPAQGYIVLFRSGRDIHVDEGGLSMPLDKFPAQLVNTGRALQLVNNAGTLIDEVVYEKAKAGVAWERSWEGLYLSTDSRGGTPGSKNSSLEIEKPVVPEETVVDFREIVFNELLPDPYTGGSEYIELYNRSKRDLSLAGLSIATRKTDGSLSTRYPLSEIASVLSSDGYALLTKDKNGVSDFYLVSSPDAVHELKLPVLANTSSTLVLFRTKDEVVIDEVQYSSKWHSAFINDEKGVALERIDPDRETQDQTNWTSASATAGYGTPGYRNSQYKIDNGGVTGIEVPKYSDLLGFYSVIYHLDEPGYSCRAYVFDLAGNRLVEIANNTLLGMEGQLTWNGKTSNGTSLKTGLYIFYVELYHVTGRKRTYKKVFLVK